jgi:Ricin-type beta-trefoil lectin domain
LFELANQNSGKCLTAQTDYTLAQFPCASANPAQIFTLKPSYDANNTLQGYEVYSPSVELAVDVWNVSTADGATIGMYKFADHTNQLFSLQPGGNGSFILVAKHSSSCFDIAAFATSDGVSLQQWGCNGGSNQAFQLIPVSPAQTPA